jgi:hypothetical protein
LQNQKESLKHSYLGSHQRRFLDVTNMITPTVEQLMPLTDDDLLDLIGKEARGALAEVGVADGPFGYPADEAAQFGVKDLHEIGARIADRVERELHDVVCGNSERDAAERLSIQKAFGLSDAVLSGALVTVLVGLGLSPAIAIAIAALLIKRVFHPAGDELCAFWAKRLSRP